jgi:hypothetical protein
LAILIKRYPDLAFAGYFYGGTEKLWFSKDNWLYLRETPDGMVPLSGVTGTCHIIDRSSALMPWAVKKATERVKVLMEQHRRKDGFYELLVEELDDILIAAKKADREILEDAGACGHIAHDHIEQIIKTILSGDETRRMELICKLPEDERAANAVIAAIEWMLAHNVKWIATEQRVLSLEEMFAGTLDGLALVSSCDDEMCCPKPFTDRLSITDWKTSNYLFVEHLLQTSAYWKARVEEKNDAIEDRWIIRLGKDDAEFDPWHAEGVEAYQRDWAAFKHALDLTRSLKTIEADLSDIKNKRKAAMKLKQQAAKLAQAKILCPKSAEYKGKKMSKCWTDGDQSGQCEACAKKYAENH